MVDRGRVRPQDTVDQPDRIDRIEGLVFLSLLELAGVEFAPVKDHPLHQALVGRQLHLHVVNRPRAISRLDVENRQLVVLEILGVEGVLEGNIDNRLLRPEDRVQQADQAWGGSPACRRSS